MAPTKPVANPHELGDPWLVCVTPGLCLSQLGAARRLQIAPYLEAQTEGLSYLCLAQVHRMNNFLIGGHSGKMMSH